MSKIFYKRWEANQFDRLAAGSLAGHLIECGAQVAQSPLDDNQHLLRADQSLLQCFSETVSDLASFTFPIMFPYSAQEVITVTEGLLADEPCLVPNDYPFLYNFCLNLKLTIPSLTVHWRQPH